MGSTVNITAPAVAEFINSARSHKRSKSYSATDLATGVNEIISVIASNYDMVITILMITMTMIVSWLRAYQ